MLNYQHIWEYVDTQLEGHSYRIFSPWLWSSKSDDTQVDGSIKKNPRETTCKICCKWVINELHEFIFYSF